VSIENAAAPAAKKAPSRASIRLWWLLIVTVSIAIWVLAIKSFALVVSLF